eukprot:scaffold524_cov357-Pavlova_lutheri.AAC.4
MESQTQPRDDWEGDGVEVEDGEQRLLDRLREAAADFEKERTMATKSLGSVDPKDLEEATNKISPTLTKLGRSELPFVVLEWTVDYAIQTGGLLTPKRKRKTINILQDVQGKVCTGQFVGIMGPSGSGKTSLLNVLAGRVPTGSIISGSIKLNGQDRHEKFRSMSTYVLQQEILFPSLTVRETMETAAFLRLPRAYSRERKREICDGVMMELGLVDVADTLVGDARIRGISGGEKKRTNIGVEMISDPVVCFLDEPTSGIDSYQALNVMETLSLLAKNGRVVLSTIHQPRSSIFQMFDQLLLLARGKVVYFGAAQEAVDYFSKMHFVCPDHYNPADFFMDLVSTDNRTAEFTRSSLSRVQLLLEYYSRCSANEACNHMDGEGGEEECHAGGEVNTRKLNTYSIRSGASWFEQLVILLLRSFKKNNRDLGTFYIGIAQLLTFAILLGLLYMDMGNDFPSIQDRTGVLFFITINVGFGGIFTIINTFPAERLVVNRERASKSYNIGAYYLGKLFGELHVRLLPTLLYALVLYYFVGLYADASRYFTFIGVALLLALTCQAFASVVSVLVPTQAAAFALAPAVSVILILFGGFYINQDTVPVGARWVKYISAFYYGFYALMINEMEGQQFGCPTVCLETNDAGECVREQEPDPDCTITGQSVLGDFGFTGFTIGQTQLLQFALFLGWHSLAYVILRFNKPRFAKLDEVQTKKK